MKDLLKDTLRSIDIEKTYPAGIEPTTSLLPEVRSIAVLQPLPPPPPQKKYSM